MNADKVFITNMVYMDTVMLKGKRKTIRIHNKTKHT